jgi:hypothetical protein
MDSFRDEAKTQHPRSDRADAHAGPARQPPIGRRHKCCRSRLARRDELPFERCGELTTFTISSLGILIIPQSSTDDRLHLERTVPQPWQLSIECLARALV